MRDTPGRAAGPGHRGPRGCDAAASAAAHGTGPDRRRVRADQGHTRPSADRRRAGDLLGHVERALFVQVVAGAPAAVRREGAADRCAAGRHGAERRGRGHRAGLRGHLQDRVAQSSLLRGAVPGGRDRGGRDRPRHPGDGRQAGGRDGRAQVLPGVVGGISFYGNCLGLPNIGGELAFDPCYAGNPLVNALCVGVMRHEDLQLAAASGEGNKVILFGARTGPDGIGGASVLASASFGGGESAKRPSVQVGDPFMEKLLVECCLELGAAGLVRGIQDLGAAGISCATAELAAGGGSGMAIRLDAVPLRDPSLGPAEILMSESQERMMAIAAPGDVERFLAICARWEVPATVIGEVSGTGRLEMTWHGEQIVDIPPGSAADEGPVYDRVARRPDGQDRREADDPAVLTRPAGGPGLRAALLALVSSPDAADKAWVTEQY